MRTSRAAYQLFALVAIAGLMVSGCGSSSSKRGGGGPVPTTTPGKEGGTFIDGAQLNAPPRHIDPLVTSSPDGAQISTLLYDGLTEFEQTPNGPVLKPLVAESWTVNADATEFIFKIRAGEVFDNGEPVLPSSFARGFNIAADPTLNGDYSYLYQRVKGYDDVQAGKATTLSGVKADDAAMTLTVDLTQSYADFPAVVSHIDFSPMPPERAKLKDQSLWERGIMIGNGPFKMAAPVNDREISLVRNDNWGGDVYGNKRAKLDGVTFRIFQDPDSAYAAFQAGEVMSATIPPERYATATARYANTANSPSLVGYHYIFGMRDRDPLGGADKVKLRAAISLAIDRKAINDSVFGGTRTISTGITPPGVAGFQPNLCKWCVSNMDEAKRVLKEYTDAGGKIPTNIRIAFNAGVGHEGVVAIIQRNLKELGITTKLDPMTSDTYFQDLRNNGCPGLCRAGWTYDYPIYDNGMYDLFHKDSIGGNNLGWYNSAKFNDAIDAARKIVDDAARQAKYREAEDIVLNQDVAAVPINWSNNDQAYAAGVENYRQEPLGFVRFEQVSLDNP